MESSVLYFILVLVCLCTSILTCLADSSSPLQDVCPSASLRQQQTIFMNGLPCKNPITIMASDFKNSNLNHPGDTDNFLRSSMNIITAADFPGLNTLGLSIARTDLDVDGMVLPHYHPRASEMLFVMEGVVVAGFIDTGNQLFQKMLSKGDVFVIPRGLLHFSLNAGYEIAAIVSVLNSQNPGVVSITEAMFGFSDLDGLQKRFLSFSSGEVDLLIGGNMTRGLKLPHHHVDNDN
uniref:Germin-like protein n=1 Tax=Nelumbo nucifera TaxID=4432 RepID=A0A822YDD9_NELNU|nr:TPA_asm: hypothetical protein HUJ06_009203 [Nelumbo nucifera]